MGFETKLRCMVIEGVRAVEEKGSYQSKPELSDALLLRVGVRDVEELKHLETLKLTWLSH